MLNKHRPARFFPNCVGQIASTHSSSATRIRRLEVERKFLVTRSGAHFLREGTRFTQHESLGERTFHDTYYDYDQQGTLFSKGIYVRRRNGRLEAKIRTGGDFVNSAFAETDDRREIMETVKRCLDDSSGVDGASSSSIEEMLEPCADFSTKRESWMIDDRFRVDVDTTDFGHSVGEVELTHALQVPTNEREKEKERGLRQEMDREIEIFMKMHPQAFPAGRPLGKLSAYFCRET